MKVRIRTIVEGEIGQGPVVAMTTQWCVYQDTSVLPRYEEIAEPWNTIRIVAEPPHEPASALSKKELEEEG